MILKIAASKDLLQLAIFPHLKNLQILKRLKNIINI